jgi:DNA-binding CsgD family transcriptional regulator
MPKAPVLQVSKKLLSFVGPVWNDGSREGNGTEDRPWELTVGKRRYRLVPVDSEEPLDVPVSPAELLTPRELQIVALVADGRANKQIADVLRISEWTVSTHLRRIFAKLGVDTRAAMVSRCYGVITVARE